MAERAITLRLSESNYEALRRHAESDGASMNAWVEGLLEVEDMRRRCAAHQAWLQENPEAVSFAEAWADRNFDELGRR